MNVLMLMLCAGVVTSGVALSPASPDVEAGDGSVKLAPPPRCLPRDLSSWRYKRYEEEVKVMDLGKVMTMTLEKEHYSHPVICVQDVTFGFTATTLWVTGGCRADFTVCYNTSENVDGKINTIVARTDERFSGMARLVAEIKADQARQISEMLNSMDELKKKSAAVVSNLMGRCSKQEEELRAMKSVKKQDMLRLSGLQAKEMNSYKQQLMNEIRQMNSKQANDMETLKTSANSNKQVIQLLRSQSAQQNKTISTIQTSSRNFIDKTKCKTAAVAFSAGLKVITTYKPGKAVVYNKIMSNIGGGYNGNTGIFTCQVPGMYTFNVEALTQHNRLADLHIYHNNNNKLARLYVDDGQGYNSGSTSAMLSLRKGDTVQVKAYTYTTLHDASWGPHNTFSGVRTPDLLQDCA